MVYRLPHTVLIFLVHRASRSLVITNGLQLKFFILAISLFIFLLNIIVIKNLYSRFLSSNTRVLDPLQPVCGAPIPHKVSVITQNGSGWKFHANTLHSVFQLEIITFKKFIIFSREAPLTLTQYLDKCQGCYLLRSDASNF